MSVAETLEVPPSCINTVPLPTTVGRGHLSFLDTTAQKREQAIMRKHKSHGIESVYRQERDLERSKRREDYSTKLKRAQAIRERKIERREKEQADVGMFTNLQILQQALRKLGDVKSGTNTCSRTR